MKNDHREELYSLIAEILPVDSSQWDTISMRYNFNRGITDQRSGTQLKEHFNQISRSAAPKDVEKFKFWEIIQTLSEQIETKKMSLKASHNQSRSASVQSTRPIFPSSSDSSYQHLSPHPPLPYHDPTEQRYIPSPNPANSSMESKVSVSFGKNADTGREFVIVSGNVDVILKDGAREYFVTSQVSNAQYYNNALKIPKKEYSKEDIALLSQSILNTKI